MPDQRLQKTRGTLPTGYQFGDARPVLCYFCQRDITTEAKVRMGEYEPRFECTVCTDCATQPYPLAELSRTSAAYRITQAQQAHDKDHGT